jgi:hypothetical protein
MEEAGGADGISPAAPRAGSLRGYGLAVRELLAELSLRGSDVIHEGVGPVEDVTQSISDICKRSKSE